MVEQPLGLSLVHQAFGPYRAERLSFATGLSTFVFARHAETGARVIVKVFDYKEREDTTDRRIARWRGRFEREVRLYDRIRHEHIIHPLMSGEMDSGLPFIVFPRYPATLVDEIGPDTGVSSGLKRRARTPRAVPVGRAVKVLRDTLSGLAALHVAGIVHRDVKPSNTFLTRKTGGAAVIADLGLALVPGAPKDAEGGWVGTPKYMAPEQNENADDVDARADVYAAGLVAFRMLAGRLPQDGERSLAQAGATVPAWLDGLIADAVAPEVVTRPETAGAFLETIDWARARGLR